MSKLIYIANIRIPTEKAHGIQIMNMCEAFAMLKSRIKNQESRIKNLINLDDLNIELVAPARVNKIKKTPFEYYNIQNIFKIKKLPVIDLIYLDLPFAFLIETFTFWISVFFHLLFQKEKYILYTRGEMMPALAFFAGIFKKPLFWETHIMPNNFKPYQNGLKNVSGLITVTEYYKKELSEKYNISADKIFNYPDGVDLKLFNAQMSVEDAKKKLNLPLDKKIILYIGSFVSWKGADIFLDIADSLSDETLLVLVAGGEIEDIEKFELLSRKLKKKNLLILKYKPHHEIPCYLQAADLLILTGTAKSQISMHYTSPLKLFEYMTSNRPILAADILSFREILNDDNSFFYKSDDNDDFIKQVNFIFDNYREVDKKTKQAFEDVQQFSWQKRAGKILEFMDLRVENT